MFNRNYNAIAICIFTALLLFSCDSERLIYPERKEIVETVYASGTIIPADEHWLSAEITGNISRKYVKEGDTVIKGQLLYTIADDAAKHKYNAALLNLTTVNNNLSLNSPVLRELQMAINTTCLRYEEDSINYHRWKKLWDRDIGTRSNLDKAYTAYRAAEYAKNAAKEKYVSTFDHLTLERKKAITDLAIAQQGLSNTSIYSDLDGIVYRLRKEEGEYVANGERIAMIGHGNGRLLRLEVDQQDISKITIGQIALVSMDAYGDKIVEGTVSFISPSMSENEQTFRVDVKSEGLPSSLFLHSAVEANIIVNTRKAALVLPKNALASADSCWVKENKKRKKIKVETGITNLDEIEILSGLTEKTAVIVNK